MEIFREYERKARQVEKGLWAGGSSKLSSSATPESAPEADVDGEMTVYVTKSGKKYHYESCRWGNKPIPLEKARESYSPCAVCNPPK